MPEHEIATEAPVPVQEPAPAAAPAVGPVALPRVTSPQHIVALNAAAGNAIVARWLLARRDADAPAKEPTKEEAVALAAQPLDQIATTVAGWGAQRTQKLEGHLRHLSEKQVSRVQTASYAVNLQSAGGVSSAQVFDLASRLDAAGASEAERRALLQLAGVSESDLSAVGGLALPSQLDEFAKSSTKVAAGLALKTGFQPRADEILALVNARLSAVGVPAIKAVASGAGGKGTFDPKKWTMTIEAALGDKLDETRANDYLTTAYHEARHAEQYHLVARKLAGDGKDAAQIHAETEVELTVCADAIGKKIEPGSPAYEAAAKFHSSFFGAESKEKEAQREALAPITEEMKRKARAGIPLTDEEQEIVNARDRLYRGRTHEADAFWVEAMMKRRLGSEGGSEHGHEH